MNKPYRIILILLLMSFTINAMAQEYYDTHVENKYVKENVFFNRIPDKSDPPVFEKLRDKLPQPVWQARQDVISGYWKAWEIAFRNIRKAEPEVNGFISPFIDPAFNGHIFMWDSHFMLMFGKYGTRAFNFQNTLNNFYVKQHKDGFICREIKESDGKDFFERFDVNSTGPNVFPWTEWEYYLNFNDTLRLKEVFPPLLAYYQWFKTYRSWQDGTYYSSGWGCGMDNQPRLPEGLNHAWEHGHMSWIDITCQQVFAGNILVKMAERLGRLDDVKDIATETEYLKKLINDQLWDDKSAFYYDRFKDGTLSNVKSIASYWALVAGIVPNEKADSFITHLTNPDEFARLHRVATLSADHPEFNPEGEYWKGSVWAPTNYMVLRGLTNYGQDSLAFEIAYNHLNHVIAVYNQTETFFENYAPDKIKGNDRKDFIGWTGLVPITVLFEYVFGIRPDVPENEVVWDINLTDEFGVRNYPLGDKGIVTFHCDKRKSVLEEPKVKVTSNVPFKLKVMWPGGSKVINVN